MSESELSLGKRLERERIINLLTANAERWIIETNGFSETEPLIYLETAIYLINEGAK
jgi:hypothetical protein